MDTTISIEPVKVTANNYYEEGRKLQVLSDQVHIETFQDVEQAQELLKNCHSLKKRIDERKAQIKRPALDFNSEVEKLYKVAVSPVNNALDIVKKKIVEFNNKVEEEKRKQRLFEEGIQGGSMANKPESQKLFKEILKEDAKIKGIRKKRVFKAVINEADIPDEYWTLDMAKINKHLAVGIIIPGVDAEEVTTVQ